MFTEKGKLFQMFEALACQEHAALWSVVFD